jgi:L-threonylcarbamoyladenylate synthase
MIVTLADAARLIREGRVVAFPTETVYGLGANALKATAVSQIYKLKGRPPTSPLIVHVDSIAMAKELVSEWPGEAETLVRRYWPGPLTIVVRKSPLIPDAVTAGLPTVGLRMPDHPLALQLIEEARVPIAAPSANKFTQLSPTTAAHVREAFGDAMPVLDGGPTRVGLESTVVSLVEGDMKLLRPGMLSIAELPVQKAGSGAHPAPGMHHRHYAPRTKLMMAAGSLPEGTAYLYHTNAQPAAVTRQLPADAAGYAAGLYAALHELDQAGVAVIAIEPVPESAEWNAIRDRLKRASAEK